MLKSFESAAPTLRFCADECLKYTPAGVHPISPKVFLFTNGRHANLPPEAYMQPIAKSYTDIDYESFPIAGLDLDLHWIQFPNSVLAERRRAKLEALECERIAALPKDHKVILVPTGPSYSPIEEELWPLVNHTVQQCLLPHPELRATINPAVLEATAEHRGWRNPFPADLDDSPKPKSPIRAK